MRVFWERGYRASTFADLMKAADVQKQSLYGAFGDKRSLFLKSLELYRNQVLSEVQRPVDARPTLGSRELRASCSTRLSPPVAKNSPSGCLMANTALELGLSDPDVAVEVKKLFRRTGRDTDRCCEEWTGARRDHDPVCHRRDRAKPCQHDQRAPHPAEHGATESSGEDCRGDGAGGDQGVNFFALFLTNRSKMNETR